MSFSILEQLICIWFLILLVLTIRGITPRYKTDVLITIIWKILLPLTICDLLVLVLFTT